MSTNPPQVGEQPTSTTIGEGTPQVQTPQVEPAKPPEGFAPIAALQGEQKVAREAREQLENLKFQLQARGMSLNPDGTIAGQAPQIAQTPGPQYAPQTPPNLQSALDNLEDRLGLGRGEISGALGPALGAELARAVSPLVENMVSVQRDNFKNQDPDYPVYAQELDKVLQERPWLKTDMRTATEIAKGRTVSAISERRASQMGGNPQTVGRFVEGASPGAGGGVAAQLPPDLEKYADGLSADAKARIAERIKNRSR